MRREKRPASPAESAAPARKGSRPLITANSVSKRRAKAGAKAPGRRISGLLRDILANNPDAEEFTIGGILDAIGAERPEASLVLFSVPHMVPVPGAPSFCGMTAASVGGHFVTGDRTLRLPKAVLQKKVPRRSLAVAIHAVLPVLEFAEKSVQPRLAWASHPACRRIIGLLIFILAATIAFPLIGFDPLHAISIFMMSIGMAEQDGVAILLGAGVGILSLAVIAGTSLKLHRKVGPWLKRAIRRMGLAGLAGYLEARGWKRLASIVRFDWKDLLLKWNPERAEMERRARAKTQAAPPAPTRGRRPAQSSRLATGVSAAKATAAPGARHAAARSRSGNLAKT